MEYFVPSASFLVAFAGYMLFVLMVGFYAARFNRDIKDFYVGDRRVGSWVTAISASASSESGWLVLGLSGLAFAEGVSAVWVVVGCLGGYLINWFLVARRLRRMAVRYDALTLPDLLESRTGGSSPTIRVVAMIIIFTSMMAYVGAQLIAAGKTFEFTLSSFGVDYRWGVLLGALITITYTTAGGYRAVAWTDLVQGLLMVIALVVVPVVAIASLGGPVRMFQILREEPAVDRAILTYQASSGAKRFLVFEQDGGYIVPSPKEDQPWMVSDVQTPHTLARVNLLDGGRVELIPLETAGGHSGESSAEPIILTKGSPATLPAGGTEIGPGDPLTYHLYAGHELINLKRRTRGLAWWFLLLHGLGIGLGYPGMPHVVNRFIAVRSDRRIKMGRFIALFWGVFAYYGAVFTGLSARALVLRTPLIDPEHAFLRLNAMIMPAFLGGLMLSAAFAAMRSTADSQLLVAASGVTRDIYQKVLGGKLSRRGMLWLSRAAVLVLGLSAMLLAAGGTKRVFNFVLYAWAILGGAFSPAVLLSLYWKRMTRPGLIWGMIAGGVTAVVWKESVRPSFGLYELVPAFFLGLMVNLAVSLATTPPEGVGEEIVG
jgi:sodium/proline symporter